MDYFLSQVIELLKHNQDAFETALMYVSDHGESLGEKGVYLHGLPGFLAPDTQTHVASLLWFGENYDEINVAEVRKHDERDYSHDNIFHTVLGLMEIETSVYNRDLDIIFSGD
jgi:lipid A ethanolaminephosphotransferase